MGGGGGVKQSLALPLQYGPVFKKKYADTALCSDCVFLSPTMKQH